MRRFVKEPGLAERFGQAARQKVCGTNDVHLVNAKLMHGMGIEIGGLEAVPQTGTLSAAVEPKTKREVSAP